MPIYMETSRLYRTVTTVARGLVTAEEIRNTVQQLFDSHLPEYTKIVDVSAARSDLSEEQIQRVADLLRGDADDTRGAVAFIINPNRTGFAHSFANITRGDRDLPLQEPARGSRVAGQLRAGACRADGGPRRQVRRETLAVERSQPRGHGAARTTRPGCRHRLSPSRPNP